MAVLKIKAGRYRTVSAAGHEYVVKNVSCRGWIVLNPGSRKVGPVFTTLRAAGEWVAALDCEPATDKSKAYLRSLLASRAGHPLTEQVRAYFNEQRGSGATIPQNAVSRAISALRLLAPVADSGERQTRSQVPSQRSQGSTLTKDAALAAMRAVLGASK